MSTNNSDDSIVFFADKIHVHRWPMDSPQWSNTTSEKVDLDLNKNKEKKKIVIQNQEIKINDYNFDRIKKVGVTVPLFKKRTTMVFEGHFDNVDAHVHITTSENYLEIFNQLMAWKDRCFED